MLGLHCPACLVLVIGWCGNVRAAVYVSGGDTLHVCMGSVLNIDLQACVILIGFIGVQCWCCSLVLCCRMLLASVGQPSAAQYAEDYMVNSCVLRVGFDSLTMAS
jgi:hypothetical protein